MPRAFPSSYALIQEINGNDAIVRATGTIPVTVRYSRGVEIDAACGQLRARHQRERQAS